MSDHARQQIRSALATLLKATPTTWGQVFETRIPTSRAVLPYLLIFSDGESIDENVTDRIGFYQRDANIIISGRLRLTGNNDTELIEDRIDAMAAEIESKITFSSILTTLPAIKGLHLNSTDIAVVVDDQDAPQYAELTLNYLVRYYTAEGAPTSFI